MTLQQKKLKNKLFNSMKSMGLQNNLKTQIRAQLCQKLKEKQLIHDKDKKKTHDDRLFSRILVSLVSQQLQKSGCQYSFSVYSAESGYDDKMLARQQIVQIMGIDESQKNEYFDQEYSIIANLLKKKYPLSGGTFRHISVQTSPQQIGYTLQQRLAKIDMNYRNNLTKGQKPSNTYEQVKQKVKVIEAQLKRNYEKDIERFQEFQAHAIKVNVSQQWRKKFQAYSSKLQTDYSRKLQNLRYKYKNIQQDLINKTKVFDEKIHTATKTIAQKIQLLDMKSKTMDESKKNLQMEKKRNKEQFDANQAELKKKISQYDTLLLKTNKKIEYEVGVAKLAIQQEYQQKQSQFLNKKKFIDEEYGKLMGIKDTMDIIKQQSQKLHQQNIELRKDLRTIEQQLRVAVSQNGSKSDRIDALRTEISQIKELNQNQNSQKADQIRKRKKIEKQLTQTRRQLDQLREWKQRNMQKSQIFSSQIQEQQNQIGPHKTQLQLKMEALRQERRKEIQKLKLQL